MPPCENHEKFEIKIQEVHANVIEIKEALVGTLHHKGLVTKIYELESEVCSLRTLKNKINGMVWKFAIGSIGGGGMVFFALKQIVKSAGN